MAEAKRTKRRRSATCPDCGTDSGSLEWSECRILGEPEELLVCFSCLECGCLFEGVYHLQGEFLVTDHGNQHATNIAVEAADREIAAAKERGEL